MPVIAGIRLALPFRFAAIGTLVVYGFIRVPDPSAVATEGMVRDAENLAHFEAFVPARAKLEIALRSARRLADPRLTALCLDRIGSALDFEGQVTAGAERHRQALMMARENGDRALTASIISSIGLAHWRQSEYAAAFDWLQQALAIQEQIGDETGRVRTLDFIGRVHFKKAEYQQAKESYLSALAILKIEGDRRWLSITLEDLGDLALEQGFFVEALDAFEQALIARRQMGDGAGESYMLSVIGRGYLHQGAYREALVWFERALALSRQIGDHPGLALALYHMGIAHDELADPARALALYAQALVLKEELGDRRQQAWILRHMGDAHAVLGDLSSALDAHGRALRIWEQIRDPRGIATGLSRAAVIDFELGRYEESAELFRRASALGTSQPAFLPAALAGMAKAYAAAGDEVRALKHGRRAAAMARRSSVDQVRWATIRTLGWIERRLGRREEALLSYLESLAIIETLRGRLIASGDVRAGFLEGKQAVYAETVELLMELGRVDEALEIAERARARAFIDLLSGRDLATKPIDQTAVARIASLEETPSREARPALLANPVSFRKADRGELLRAEPAALSAAWTEPASLVTTSSLTLKQARREARRSGATILEYFSTADRLFIWVLAPDGAIRAASSPISRRELAALVGGVRTAMDTGAAVRNDRGPESSGDAGSDPRPLLRQLHRVLIEPVADFLPENRERLITIVPHGPLFLVSFAALVDGDGKYFVEGHTIAYSPSIGVLRYTGRNRDRAVKSTAPRLLVVGNPGMSDRQPLAPLPGAEREAMAIGALYPPGRVSTLVGSRARERTVRELAPGQTVIHLATHAVVFDDDPMGSYLALTPDSEPGSGARNPLGDGRLTAAEVFGLDLHADLVTLSACNTGLGRVNGEGVIGLSRAFMYAGTASVLVSLWRVADSVATTEMERFYRALIRTGGNKAAALAAAQREVIALLRAGGMRSPSGRALAEHPVLWAPFVLVGEAR